MLSWFWSYALNSLGPVINMEVWGLNTENYNHGTQKRSDKMSRNNSTDHSSEAYKVQLLKFPVLGGIQMFMCSQMSPQEGTSSSCRDRRLHQDNKDNYNICNHNGRQPSWLVFQIGSLGRVYRMSTSWNPACCGTWVSMNMHEKYWKLSVWNAVLTASNCRSKNNSWRNLLAESL